MDSHSELLAKYRVTNEQLDAAERVEDLNAHKVYYRLPSQTRAGHEHIVQFNLAHHRLECSCEAGTEGMTCWAMRAALCHAEIIRQERINRQERDMIALAQEMAAEARAAAPFTVQTDETSSSLDGITWAPAGEPGSRSVPMR